MLLRRSDWRSFNPYTPPMMNQPNRFSGLTTLYDSVMRVPVPSGSNR